MKTSVISSVLVLVSFLIWGNLSEAKHGYYQGTPRYSRNSLSFTSSSNRGAVNDDSDLVRAVNDRRNVNFVQAAGVTVTKVLPDDTQGLPHQKWKVRLSSGAEVLAVYNSDMGERVPVKVGTVMALGGEFKMTNIGPLIHWLHRDPQHRRPDGYVEINGKRYGDN